MLESTRAEEDRVKRETAEGLALFRQQQEEADKRVRRESNGAAAEEGSTIVDEDTWVSGGRKRKRTKEKEGFKGVKLRRPSTSIETIQPTDSNPASPAFERSLQEAPKLPAEPLAAQTQHTTDTATRNVNKKPLLPRSSGLGLVGYGSDEDDDW